MKDTCSRQIYNYLVEFNSPLNVRVMKNNDVVIEGNATKTTAFSGFSMDFFVFLFFFFEPPDTLQAPIAPDKVNSGKSA